MTIAPFFPYFQSLFPKFPKPQATLLLYPINTWQPLAFLEADLNLSPISSLGCLVDKPSLGCKPWHLSIWVSCELGRRAWFGDTKANLQVQAPWAYSSPFSNSGWLWLSPPFLQLPWAFLASIKTFSWSPSETTSTGAPSTEAQGLGLRLRSQKVYFTKRWLDKMGLQSPAPLGESQFSLSELNTLK